MTDATTHFGFKQVPLQEKAGQVAAVFHSVAAQYDLMNDAMSGGLHRIWKNFTVQQSHLRQGQRVLDIAGGTGDLAQRFLKRVGKEGSVILSDINGSMLACGRTRAIDAGYLNTIQYVQADAEQLPFIDNYFDCVSIGFGLRNVTDKPAALRSMYRVLKPGGTLLILEFSKPTIELLQQIYDKYSFKLIPWLGEKIANDRASYEYLVESIRMHPDQIELKNLMVTAGFEDVDWFNLSGGIVALHKGFKY
jgi:demethylmenaquinone methyltransferase/2-methoxy-6-polyprenyl-1,4-benzoquinol methylase